MDPSVLATWTFLALFDTGLVFGLGRVLARREDPAGRVRNVVSAAVAAWLVCAGGAQWIDGRAGARNELIWASHLLASLVWMVIGIVRQPGAAGRSDRPHAAGMKECPLCTVTIPTRARVCPNCKRDLP